ncbi:hypothetical protein [Citrobacter braakii]|uniref:hypothetical protein n=1 Tax=Citrobacter braakii TaxID=57706 RepID=UPI00403906A9
MRMTNRKKEILSYFEPDNLAWVVKEIGAPPLDVSGVAYLLNGGTIGRTERYKLESTRRTLEIMVKNGQLERVRVKEARETHLGGEVTTTVIRYGLPGTCTVIRDEDGADNVIDGGSVCG